MFIFCCHFTNLQVSFRNCLQTGGLEWNSSSCFNLGGRTPLFLYSCSSSTVPCKNLNNIYIYINIQSDIKWLILPAFESLTTISLKLATEINTLLVSILAIMTITTTPLKIATNSQIVSLIVLRTILRIIFKLHVESRKHTTCNYFL